MEARCTALAVQVAKLKSRQEHKIPSAVQVSALVRKENWDPYTWDGTVSDNDDDWDWENEVEVRVAELGEVEGGKESVVEVHPLVQIKSKGVNGGQIQNSHLVRDYTQRPDVEPVTAGIRARLIRNAPPHMKGALLALLGPAQGRPVGDVVLLMAQLEGLDRQKSARAAGQANKYKGGESTIKVTRRRM
ncbi:hypothetical protein NDU88_002099 [Pleurodeles waltl]|uniref:Uncharacterized protein n=1 Tax=Pleurodeles waltl TaxID=8319 RepID=A0AAV7VBJ3_PLEWA|nr:hypothetical protein NDU88_002099 [Pleurodeles waltl]